MTSAMPTTIGSVRNRALNPSNLALKRPIASNGSLVALFQHVLNFLFPFTFSKLFGVHSILISLAVNFPRLLGPIELAYEHIELPSVC